MKLKIVVSALVVMALTGCHLRQSIMEQPSLVSPVQSTLKYSRSDFRDATAHINADTLWAQAASYRDNGVGPAEVTVTYDPASHTNTAMKAANEAQRVSATLKRAGIAAVTTDILPAAAGSASETLISYKSLIAQGPAGCNPIGGMDNKPTEPRDNYDLGCTLNNQIARQVAHPADMLGRGGLDTASGRRAGNIDEIYQQGKPNPPMQNMQSSSSTTTQ